MNRGLAGLARAALVGAGVAIVAIALVQAWQVVARYVLNDSPSWTEPVAILLMNFAMMLGAAVGVRNEAHFGFFIGVHAAPRPLRRVLLAFARFIEVAIGLLLAGWGVRLVMANLDFQMAGVPLPQGIMYAPIALGGALIAVFALDLLIRAPDSPGPGH
jgi:TRAP-type C4-dicarboxylate transport system permease small subunit